MARRRESDLPSIGAFARGDGDGRSASSAVAALSVALAADLSAQVASAASDWDERGGALAQADALRERALALAAEAEEAFADALAGLEQAAIPSTPRSAHSDLDLGNALDLSVQLLLAIGEAASDAAELAELVARNGATVVRADAVAATILATAAAEMVAHLIEINLLVAGDDERAGRARALVAAARSSRDTARTLER